MRLLLCGALTLLALAFIAPAPAALMEGTGGGVAARRAHPAQPEPLALAWPAKGKLTDDFGPRWGRMHRGIDIGILRSLKLVAAEDGIVRRTGYIRGFEGYGQVVLLDVGRGFRLLYAHLSKVSVRRGQHVEAGESLGLAGCTGSCTGTHLHFEVHKKGRAVNPMPFLRRYTAQQHKH